MSKPTLKANVARFGGDVLEHGGYVYTTNNRFSSTVANERLTRATLDSLRLVGAENRQILDVGCGDGTYTRLIQQAFPRAPIVAFDPAESAVQRAKELYDGIRFLVADALVPRTLDGCESYAAVIRGVLHHTPDPAQIIKNLRPLAQNLIIIEPNGLNPVLKILEKVSHYHREHEEQSFTAARIRRWCRAAGYRVRSCSYVGFVPMFSPNWLAKPVHFVQPFFERVPLIRNFFAACSVIVCERDASPAA